MGAESKLHAAAVRMMVTKRPGWRREITALGGGNLKVQHGVTIIQKTSAKKGSVKEKGTK
jgi:hypothetical protein